MNIVPLNIGDPCPCKDCPGVFEDEDGHPLCPVCGYCPEPDFDNRIDDCPACGSFAHIINQSNIICSGCGLELTVEYDREEEAIEQWNGIARPGTLERRFRDFMETTEEELRRADRRTVWATLLGFLAGAAAGVFLL